MSASAHAFDRPCLSKWRGPPIFSNAEPIRQQRRLNTGEHDEQDLVRERREHARTSGYADRPEAGGDTGHFGRPEWIAGRRVRPLPENQELSLAHERSPLPRLPPAARRAWRPDIRDDGPDRGTGSQDRRNNIALDRADSSPAAYPRQRCGLRRAAGHAGGTSRRQQATRRDYARGPQRV